MKNTILFFVLFLFVFFPGCKKSSTTPEAEYLMTFKVNGIADTLINYYGAVQPTPSSTKTDFFVNARSKDNKNHFLLSIQQAEKITSGTYETGNNDYFIIADYFKNQAAPDERDFTIDNADGKPNGYFKIVITSISNTLITGTFSSNYLYDRTYNESLVITDGSFAVKRNK